MFDHSHDEEEESIDINELFDALPEYRKEEFFQYLGDQVKLVMDKAESHGVLFDLITQWPREKQVAFEMATVIEHRVLNDDED